MDEVGDAPPVEITNDDLHGASGEGMAIEQGNENPIRVEIVKFRMISEEGFFIAKCKLLSDPHNLPAVWKGRLKKNDLIVKGNAQSIASLDSVGSSVECLGEWVVDPRFGLQYKFTWARESMPSTIEALEKYLAAGRIKGIGPATAKIMVDKWGMETFDVLDKFPDKLKEIPGLTDKKIKEIKDLWEKKRSLYHLTSFFGMYGIGEVWIDKIVETLGKKGLEARVKDNPYLLTMVDGIGFSTADKMAIAIGFDKNNPKRVAAFLCHLLEEYSKNEGHTACPADEWFKQASMQLGLSVEKIQPIAQELINSGGVFLRNLEVSRDDLGAKEGRDINPEDLIILPCVTLRKNYMAEKSIAMDIKRLKDNIKNLKPLELMKLNQAISNLANTGKKATLDPSQIEGVFGVLKNGISVLTGGPGTGKTTTLKNVIDIAEGMGWEVILAAPTGRAAKRMEEAVGRKAKTIHRTLGFNPKEKGGFSYNRKNKIPGTLFVVDESSMIDNSLGASWLRALPDGARALFVGDVNQLPSVGAGSFLNDIIASKVAKTFTLTKVHRQAKGSLIAEAAQKILSGKAPLLNSDPWVDDFAWITPPQGLNSEQTNDFINTSISSLVDGFLKKGYNKNDIQILSPQHSGAVGVSSLNHSLREQLNEKGKLKFKNEDEQDFALGDRMLITKNNYDKEVFNGDMGIVSKIEDDGTVMLKMEDGRDVEFNGLEKKALTLGYAITVHKSQGGEKPVILMTCSPSHTFSMNKNLIYTAITRGKEKVVVVGSAKTLQTALRKQAKMYRLTGLVDEIHHLVKPAVKKIDKRQSFCPK